MTSEEPAAAANATKLNEHANDEVPLKVSRKRYVEKVRYYLQETFKKYLAQHWCTVHTHRSLFQTKSYTHWYLYCYEYD